MRRLVGISVALVIALGIVAGNLWMELRAARQEITELRAQVRQPVEPALLAQAAVAAATVSEVPATATPVSTTAAVVAVPPPLPAPPPVQPPVVRPAPVITDAIRTNALLQADQTATARVLVWKDRLALAGHTLTTEQLQALNKVATAELHRETEESLNVASNPPPGDMESALRLREETLNRQHGTNMRILAAMSAHFTSEQSQALRTQFETGHATRLAGLRADADLMRQQR